MAGDRGAKIAYLTNIPAPYHIELWNYMARVMDGRLAVRFIAPSEHGRWWTVPTGKMEFDWAYLTRSHTTGGLKVELRAAAATLVFLTRYQPSAVICGGYDTLAAWMGLLWCMIARRRFVLWLVGTVRDFRKRSRIRALLKRLFISLADAIAAGGKAAVEYVKALGAKNEQIFVALQGCDNKWIQREASKVNVTEEKRRRGYPPRLILYSGRLARPKGVFELLRAYKRVSVQLPDVGLLIVGDGPEREAMERFCQEERLDRVHFAGSKEYAEMPGYYALADVVVLPTFSDTWGWVVNEAFACGVPTIVSRAAGACEDLIIEGETGYSTEPGNAEELADKILRLLKNDELRASMGRKGRELIERYSVESLAEGLLAAAGGCRTPRNV